jgi:hypothetical protein
MNQTSETAASNERCLVFCLASGGSYITSHMNVIELSSVIRDVWRVLRVSEEYSCGCIYQGKTLHARNLCNLVTVCGHNSLTSNMSVDNSGKIEHLTVLFKDIRFRANSVERAGYNAALCAFLCICQDFPQRLSQLSTHSDNFSFNA